MKVRSISLIFALILFTCVGAFASQSAAADGVKADSAAARQVQLAKAQPSSLSKQASVTRTTKKTNWSKIKNLFE